jgi:transposase
MVCIDDFAIRKRESYGTIMVDIQTHRVIDLIPSRECNDVIEWLKTYPNLKVVSRDGSITYHNAINTAHPEAMQVSDRFHLLKNLTSYCKDYLMKYFKANIPIKLPEIPQVDDRQTLDKSSINKKLTLEEKAKRAISMLAEGSHKTQCCKQLNMDSRTLDKLIGMNEEERKRYVKSLMELSHEQKVLKKQEIIDTVRDMHRKGLSARVISKELQLSRQTVKKYLDQGITAVHGSYNVKRKSILDPYLDEINMLIDKGVATTEIEAKIRQKGYTGSSSTLRNYASGHKKLIQKTSDENDLNPKNTKLVERKLLMSLLFKRLEKIKGLDKACLERVNSQYPRFKELIDIVDEFKNILLDKNVGRIEQWILKASGLNISEINSFINGITRDITAVKNAIKYEYNNGLAEGSVNKLKVIKRIMYGRNSFEMLRKKLLRLEKNRKFN